MPGPLGSDLLSGNDRLQQCAQHDAFNVKPDEPASEHVKLIQDALREVDKANIPASEKNYGPKTTEAVVNFKTKHRIFTRGTQSIDPIVGINTSRKLDASRRQAAKLVGCFGQARQLVPRRTPNGFIGGPPSPNGRNGGRAAWA